MITLDAGHGERNNKPTGARGNGLIEDDLALDFTKRIGHHIRAAGIVTYCTRPGVGYVELDRRAIMACAKDSDLFLSIHINAAGPDADGVEAYIVPGQMKSYDLARQIVSSLGRWFDIRHKGTNGVLPDTSSHVGRLAVLRGTYQKMPAILLELGFISSAKDAAVLKDKVKREEISKAIAGIVVSYLKA
jgi:N-acetylmuramoyl-L-alanine amidase